MFEREGGKDEVAWVELLEGCVADKVADVGVFVFASKFLKDNLTLVEGWPSCLVTPNGVPWLITLKNVFIFECFEVYDWIKVGSKNSHLRKTMHYCG